MVVFFLDLISESSQKIKSQSKRQRQTKTVVGSGGYVNAGGSLVLAVICDWKQEASPLLTATWLYLEESTR
jgi:50S ribosomal subunit-associated GTPase HflX